MNIAITSLYLPSGSKIGVGYQVHGLANALVGRGHEVTVFSSCGPSPDSRYQVVVVPPPRRLRTFGFAWQLRRYDFGRFDVLNAHGDDWFLWGRRRPRHVHTFHGSCLAEMLHARTLTDKARMGALAVCEYNACLLADELVAVSANTRRYVPMVRRVIPCGVDTAAFHPGTEAERSAHPTLLFVGTMHGRKRGAMLLDLFRRQVKPNVKGAEFWAVCDKPAGEPDNEPGVRWFGRVAEFVLTDLFRRAWAFCLPSTYEGFGVPYIEAMASGTPVVASPNVGALEVTCRGRCGLVATDEHLAETLVGVLKDESLRLRLRRDGLERARDFSWQRVCEQYEAAYTGSHPGPAPAAEGAAAVRATV
jgi:glycosyltransferase involved in cell wall biosynthesis